MSGARIYSYEEIKQRITCDDAATQLLGANVSDNRCAAVWRGGDNPKSVAFDGATWYDHVTHVGGSVLDLVKVAKEITLHEASIILGDHLGLSYKTPKPDISTRESELLRDGYQETARYRYTDENSNLIMQVVRYEHPVKPKEFLQCDAVGRWKVKHLQPVLYNLPNIINASHVFVVEGEKDADRLIAEGLVATTNAGGTKKWTSSFTEHFAGKVVAILYDNDTDIPKGMEEPVGITHAKVVAASIIRVAKAVIMVKTSDRPKGDVSDYLNDGNTVQDLFKLVDAAPAVTEKELEGIKVPLAEDSPLAIAKERNKRAFMNYAENTTVAEDGKKKVNKEPRQINKLIDECFERFVGFPRKVSDELFDHDRDTKRISYMSKSSEFFAWMARKSNCLVDWQSGSAFATKDEFFCGVRAAAQRYEAVSVVPDWPARSDVYYAHAAMPKADPDHKYLEQFCDFFNPINPAFRTALKAFIAAPVYYESSIARPLWVIGSEKAGSGKTSLANYVSMLYGRAPVEVKRRAFLRDTEEITKRLVSSEGRLARMLLIDNVTGEFKSEELSSMITMPNISGKAPYGRGEETRPNNLTYVITANDANIDDDLAIRAYFIQLDVATYRATWATDINTFINKHRLDILADIIDLITNNKPFETAPVTRFPEFETKILQAFCKDHGDYSEVISAIGHKRSESNIDEENGKEIEDIISQELIELGINPVVESVWIRSAVLDRWVGEAIPNQRYSTQAIKTLAKSGHCPNIYTKLTVYPSRGELRRRGVMWLPQGGDNKPMKIIVMNGKKPAIAHV